jgi:hypothetical protein
MKSRINKTMRVATTFTGAAACAVGFGPAATAATHVPQQTREWHGQHLPRGMTPQIKPDFEGGSCKGGTSNWVHLAWGYPNTLDWCFGFRGSAVIDGSFSMICGGNNIGWYSGISPGGSPVTHATFHQGTTYARLPGAPLYISRMGITSFKGTDKCSPPPGISTAVTLRHHPR